MMISLTRKFIFIANLKSASTAIEKVLKPYSEIAIDEARFGKHAPLTLIKTRYDWLFREIDIREFFVFGVIREPVSYMLSLYNAHSDQRFENDTNLYTANINFDDFLSQWVPRNRDQARPQYRKFIDENGYLGTNLLIEYSNLQKGLTRVAERLDIPHLVNLDLENVSIESLKRSDLTQKQMDWIEISFLDDLKLVVHCRKKDDIAERLFVEYEPYGQSDRTTEDCLDETQFFPRKSKAE